MSETFTVEIISPDRSILKTNATEVTLPSYEGEIGILKDHISLITFLRPGLIKIINGSEEKFFVEEGTIEFANNSLLILTSSAKKLSDLDKKTLQRYINDTELKIKDEKLTDKEKYLQSYKLETLKGIN